MKKSKLSSIQNYQENFLREIWKNKYILIEQLIPFEINICFHFKIKKTNRYMKLVFKTLKFEFFPMGIFKSTK